MQGLTLSPGIVVLALYVASAMYVHYRGRVRHPFRRQMLDHSTLVITSYSIHYTKLYDGDSVRPCISRPVKPRQAETLLSNARRRRIRGARRSGARPGAGCKARFAKRAPVSPG